MGLRFAVLVEGDTVCRAHARTIGQLGAIPGIECVLAIEGAARALALPADGNAAAGMEPVAIKSLIPGIRKVSLGERDAIAAAQLDFILNCSWTPADDRQAPAREGIWELCHDPDAKFGSWPPAFWGIYHRRNCSRIVLRKAGTDRILAEAVVDTIPVSYRSNLEHLLAAGVDLPVRAARNLLAGRPPASVSESSSSRFAAPSAIQTVVFRMRIAAAWAALQIRAILFMEDWHVGVVDAPIEAFLNPSFKPQVHWLPRPAPNRFWADPFAAQQSSGELTVLVEEFDNERYQGYISAVTVDSSGAQTRVLVDEGVHMSYPFPLEADGASYLIPESQRNREVALFRRDSSGQYQRVGALLRDFAALDSTVVRYQDRWWLFCTCQDDMPECKLYIFYATELTGTWQAHAMNPVKCDVRSSRPGGTPFLHQGELYRPAQDSSRGYGSALSINRIRKLTPGEFEEEVAAHRDPIAGSRYPEGLHTLSAAGARSLIDGKRDVFSGSMTLRRLRHKVRKLAGREVT